MLQSEASLALKRDASSWPRVATAEGCLKRCRPPPKLRYQHTVVFFKDANEEAENEAESDKITPVKCRDEETQPADAERAERRR